MTERTALAAGIQSRSPIRSDHSFQSPSHIKRSKRRSSLFDRIFVLVETVSFLSLQSSLSIIDTRRCVFYFRESSESTEIEHIAERSCHYTAVVVDSTSYHSAVTIMKGAKVASSTKPKSNSFQTTHREEPRSNIRHQHIRVTSVKLDTKPSIRKVCWTWALVTSEETEYCPNLFEYAFVEPPHCDYMCAFERLIFLHSDRNLQSYCTFRIQSGVNQPAHPPPMSSWQNQSNADDQDNKILWCSSKMMYVIIRAR